MAAPKGSVGVVAAQRIIHADVADVYRAIDQVERWSSWMTAVVAPVLEVGPQAYDLSSTRGGSISRHRMVVRARGPVHSFVVELDGRWLLDFRCAPNGLGTSVRVTGQRLSKPKWRERRSAQRRAETSSERLGSLLDQLAVHVENADG
jgi:hypothetical protein